MRDATQLHFVFWPCNLYLSHTLSARNNKDCSFCCGLSCTVWVQYVECKQKKCMFFADKNQSVWWVKYCEKCCFDFIASKGVVRWDWTVTLNEREPSVAQCILFAIFFIANYLFLNFITRICYYYYCWRLLAAAPYSFC